MTDIFIDLVLWHFIADFFFQTRKMSEQKYLPTKSGFKWCTIHVIVYTTIISVGTSNFSMLFIAGVFLPHWIIDRYSLAAKWMKFIGRENLFYSTDPLQKSFGAVIYVVIDQILHILCLKILIGFL